MKLSLHYLTDTLLLPHMQNIIWQTHCCCLICRTLFDRHIAVASYAEHYLTDTLLLPHMQNIIWQTHCCCLICSTLFDRHIAVASYAEHYLTDTLLLPHRQNIIWQTHCCCLICRFQYHQLLCWIFHWSRKAVMVMILSSLAPSP